MEQEKRREENKEVKIQIRGKWGKYSWEPLTKTNCRLSRKPEKIEQEKRRGQKQRGERSKSLKRKTTFLEKTKVGGKKREKEKTKLERKSKDEIR